MKKIYNIISIAIIALAAVSCKEPASISANPGSIELSDKSEAQVSVTANYEWSASSSVTWIRISPLSGVAGTANVNISVGQRPTETRSGVITFSCNGATASVTVTQTGKGASTISFVTYLKTVCVPKITTANADNATIDWGDGNKEAYAIGKTHTYNDIKAHTIVVSFKEAAPITFEQVTGMSSIDVTDC